MNQTDELTRYQAFWHLCVQAQKAMAEKLSKHVLQICGKRLGLMKKGVLYLPSQADWLPLTDYALFAFREDDHTVVENYVDDLPPASTEEERILREALTKTRYSIFEIENVVPNLGVNVRDVFRDETLFVVNQNLSKSARYIALFAARLVRLPDFAMTTVTIQPVTIPMLQLTARVLSERFGTIRPDQLKPLELSEFEGAILSTLFAAAAGAEYQYA